MENFELPCETDANCATSAAQSSSSRTISTEVSVERSVESNGAKKELATEAGHWYLPDGTPYYEVPYADPRKGMRAVTLRDARKVNAVPSVTGITNIVEKPALNNYKSKHIFSATLRVLAEKQVEDSKIPRFPEPPDYDELFKRVQVLADEHRDKAADRGTRLHAAIEQFLRGDDMSASPWREHIEVLVAALAQYGIDIHEGESEKSFAHTLGFGGKVDWHRRIDPLVWDAKSKDRIDDAKLKQWCDSGKAMQLAAYRVGLAMPSARGVNVFVGEEDREVRIFEWPKSDLKEAWENFQDLLRFWKRTNHYYPKFEQ